MWRHVGVVREADGLQAALTTLARLADASERAAWADEATRAAGEARNLLTTARLVAAAALARRESRGAHYRSDFPAPSPRWRRRLFVVARGRDIAIGFDPPVPGDSTERGEPEPTREAVPA